MVESALLRVAWNLSSDSEYVCICIWFLKVIKRTLPGKISLILAGKSYPTLGSGATNGETLQRRLHLSWRKFRSRIICNSRIRWRRIQTRVAWPVRLGSLLLEFCIHPCINIQQMYFVCNTVSLPTQRLYWTAQRGRMYCQRDDRLVESTWSCFDQRNILESWQLGRTKQQILNHRISWLHG